MTTQGDVDTCFVYVEEQL